MTDGLSALEDMIYSGRGIIVGMTPEWSPFMAYSLTGRSPPSQARELLEGENTRTIRTSVTNKEELEKGSPALLLYPVIAHLDGVMLASNGAQTKLLYSAAMKNRNELGIQGSVVLQAIMKDAFKEPFWEYDQKDDRWIDITTYEPDAPNSTPRISACMNETSAFMHIIKCGENGKKEETLHKIASLEPGKGTLITTYKGGNEKPLAPFTGLPLDIAINSNTAEGIVESVYSAIYGGANPEDNYRVAAAVMMLNKETKDISTKIINRSQRRE